MSRPDAITVSITRTVKPGCEADFERALHDFVQRSLSLPGQQGVHIMRTAPGSSLREYGIIRKFASRDALTAFRTSPEYLGWNELEVEFNQANRRDEQITPLNSRHITRGAPIAYMKHWQG